LTDRGARSGWRRRSWALVPLDDHELALLRQTLGHRCRRARLRLDLSQRALAIIMDRSPSWVRDVERGRQYAPPYLVRFLASATGVSVGWFYGEDGPDHDALADRLLKVLQRRAARA